MQFPNVVTAKRALAEGTTPASLLSAAKWTERRGNKANATALRAVARELSEKRRAA